MTQSATPSKNSPGLHSRVGKTPERGSGDVQATFDYRESSVSREERRAIMEQRVKENAAQRAYDAARQALFTLAGWAV